MITISRSTSLAGMKPRGTTARRRIGHEPHLARQSKPNLKKQISIFYFLLTLFGHARAENEPTQFQAVFDVVAAPQIYTSTRDNLLRQMHTLCMASSRSELELMEHGNVECRDAVGAASITISSAGDGRVSMIAASFNDVAKCSYMKRKLTKNFGRPKTATGACLRKWRVRTPQGEP